MLHGYLIILFSFKNLCWWDTFDPLFIHFFTGDLRFISYFWISNINIFHLLLGLLLCCLFFCNCSFLSLAGRVRRFLHHLPHLSILFLLKVPLILILRLYFWKSFHKKPFNPFWRSHLWIQEFITFILFQELSLSFGFNIYWYSSNLSGAINVTILCWFQNLS